MTQKDYIAIANVIVDATQKDFNAHFNQERRIDDPNNKLVFDAKFSMRNAIVEGLSDLFKQDNPRFDRDLFGEATVERFEDACVDHLKALLGA